jgi:hypothetical protein
MGFPFYKPDSSKKYPTRTEEAGLESAQRNMREGPYPFRRAGKQV